MPGFYLATATAFLFAVHDAETYVTSVAKIASLNDVRLCEQIFL
jgi:hypothetical protein